MRSKPSISSVVSISVELVEWVIECISIPVSKVGSELSIEGIIEVGSRSCSGNCTFRKHFADFDDDSISKRRGNAFIVRHGPKSFVVSEDEFPVEV